MNTCQIQQTTKTLKCVRANNSSLKVCHQYIPDYLQTVMEYQVHKTLENSRTITEAKGHPKIMNFPHGDKKAGLGRSARTMNRNLVKPFIEIHLRQITGRSKTTFTIETDHRGHWPSYILQNILIACWALALMPYAFEIRYRPGPQMMVTVKSQLLELR